MPAQPEPRPASPKTCSALHQIAFAVIQSSSIIALRKFSFHATHVRDFHNLHTLCSQDIHTRRAVHPQGYPHTGWPDSKTPWQHRSDILKESLTQSTCCPVSSTVQGEKHKVRPERVEPEGPTITPNDLAHRLQFLARHLSLTQGFLVS